eukprot:gene19045-63289_t
MVKAELLSGGGAAALGWATGGSKIDERKLPLGEGAAGLSEKARWSTGRMVQRCSNAEKATLSPGEGTAISGGTESLLGEGAMDREGMAEKLPLGEGAASRGMVGAELLSGGGAAAIGRATGWSKIDERKLPL